MRVNRGVTLIELLVTITILALLTIAATPALTQWSRSNHLTAGINRFHRTLALTRSQAIEHGGHAVVCKSTDGHGCTATGGWEQGWLIFLDPAEDRQCQDGDSDGRCDLDGGLIIRIEQGFTSGITLRGSGNTATAIAFKGSGFSEGYPGTLTLCDASGTARGLVLSMQGRIRLARPGEDNLHCPP
ncbi:GspH/FimT family pseudopilin [Nitrococcus mobilis]|uniref:Type II secretion system protein H n=1 Tax=Nitrococcus mobilis Nb-231 TaxID=314278 RepID=A4BTU0_9GAMM|nr:GspH/FimT family pseudopilin [Nitrococcus mobilis]EAR20904.1 putative type-4 fimbrial pilin related signal peptide protein [Nitrococcus mobilis Nb-231]